MNAEVTGHISKVSQEITMLETERDNDDNNGASHRFSMVTSHGGMGVMEQ